MLYTRDKLISVSDNDSGYGIVSSVVHTSDESLWGGLRDMWTCRTTLASAYVIKIARSGLYFFYFYFSFLFSFWFFYF